MRPSSPAARLARAGVLGSASLALAVGAHLLAGGRLPGPGTLLALAAALAAAAIPLTTRRVRVPSLVAVLAIEQVGLHLALDTAASMARGCGAGHHAAAIASCAPAGPMSTAPGIGMVLAHVVATLATAWLLARGDAWLWRLGAVAYARSAARPTVRRARHNSTPLRPAPSLTLAPALVSVRRRGPPRG